MFSEIISRADISSIGEYILSGGENLQVEEEKSFEERIRSADKEMRRFAESKLDSKLADEICDEAGILSGVYSNVYFEVGLLVGAKTALQLEKRMKELL